MGTLEGVRGGTLGGVWRVRWETHWGACEGAVGGMRMVRWAQCSSGGAATVPAPQWRGGEV